ncbi:siderophore-interacting protein [Salinibius halmophilus]|uniref:siderophore-interacting protein n=1 Tax=Salinibius halmophilus TaxID=1853216 RepID=UPI000E665641|nr:siderophore-interacting protein [Salinibius halmophilus]
MAQPKPRLVYVAHSQRLTPNMHRLVLAGPELADYPNDIASGYIKLMFNEAGQPIRSLNAKAEGTKISLRTYTIRDYDPKVPSITVDFAMHGEGQAEGIASRWARTCQVGDEIVIGGPGPANIVDLEADWFFFVGDMTSLPAISCNLEQLPPDAQGHAVIEVTDVKDIQPLDVPTGISIDWVVNATPGHQSELVERTKEKTWLEGVPQIWVACEFSNMRELRKHFKSFGATKQNLYISSYWKAGLVEEAHKEVKRADAEAA